MSTNIWHAMDRVLSLQLIIHTSSPIVYAVTFTAERKD